MSANCSTMYSIPEHPAEEELCSTGPSKKFTINKESEISHVKKKNSSISLPDRILRTSESSFSSNEYLPLTPKTPEMKISFVDDLIECQKSEKAIRKGVSVSLVDFSQLGLTSDSGSFAADKLLHPFVNTATPKPHALVNSGSYLEIKDYQPDSNQTHVYAELLTPELGSKKAGHKVYASDVSLTKTNNDEFKKPSSCSSERKTSDQLIFVDLISNSDKFGSTEGDPASLRQRSRSMQWLQNAFQNVGQRYKNLLDIRRPSDIVNERMRQSNEEFEMDESDYEVPKTQLRTPTAGGRRFSENIIGKQKRFPFSSGIEQLRDLLKDRITGLKRQEEQDNDQNRTDVCPLFNFPPKYEEDSFILDALRQAMRKCTADDPSTRPTSTSVFQQLSQILK